jgi:uncharacterized protein with GYD domain
MRQLWTAEYSAAGAAGAMKDGGTGRKAAIEQLVASVGGTLEACYFAAINNGIGVVLIVEVPSDAASNAIVTTIMASGAVLGASTITISTADEFDAALALSPAYSAPGS